MVPACFRQSSAGLGSAALDYRRPAASIGLVKALADRFHILASMRTRPDYGEIKTVLQGGKYSRAHLFLPPAPAAVKFPHLPPPAVWDLVAPQTIDPAFKPSRGFPSSTPSATAGPSNSLRSAQDDSQDGARISVFTGRTEK
jgi:hypothetical protein